MNIRKLIIKDVRCFGGRQEFNIRPITFLVGENSTGKSTALGCFQILADFMSGWRIDLDFNTEPYLMGAFADIVRRARPAKNSFQMGFELRGKSEKETIKYILTLAEKEKGSEPIVQQEKFIVPGGEVVFEVAPSDENFDSRRVFKVVDIIQEEGKKKFFVNFSNRGTNAIFWLEHLSSTLLEEENEGNLSSEDKELSRFFDNLRQNFPKRNRLFHAPFVSNVSSFAPIRSKPQRTYNPLKEEVNPEGSDMPMLLMNVSRAEKETWRKLKARLIEFGKTSGLFTDITVRRLGKSMGDPFQLQIKVKGPNVNLLDVGYGVNQILPILVRIFNAHGRAMFLMQQPEVHLHPKGQAELSSLLVDIVKRSGHGFVIETHSDYLIDRVRIEIMKRKISPHDVSLIYLEPTGNSVKVHNITFDEQANLIDTPTSYKHFFLKESDQLLGII